VGNQIVEIPLYYIVKRGLTAEQADAAMAVLSLTPCQAAFITNPVDAVLACHFTQQVISADADATAMKLARRWAEDIGRPMLVFGDADFIDAVFSDGRKEAVVANA